ncbi:ATP-binding cassette domain-containing protein [Melghirimyces algeriensis]|uniref:ABC transporter n=1 Tax=Melghirimyces algeriensis TaxID=910412 RepID=A0A521FHL7_9BACL|nr:ATP-binding cassette domain-containing protein [Melghirimyces algeriensis]SMO95151.1 ABC transporter [Melghirimyces algeriensis]
MKGVNNKAASVQSTLEKVNLSEQSEKKIGQLLGGMVRRVGIAQAISGNPRIIVVDEPTAGLDPGERIRFQKLLRSLGKDAIVLTSTHIVEDIETTCNQVAIFKKGNLIAQGPIDEIADQANGRMWNVFVSKEQFYEITDQWEVISSQKTEEGYIVRILSDLKPPHGQKANPTLENAYLYLMKSENGLSV